MGDSAGQRSQRFDFAFSEPIIFRALTFGHVTKESRDASAAGIGVNFEPLRSARVARFKFDWCLLGHNPPIILFKSGTAKFGKLLPQLTSQKLFARASERRLCLRVHVGKAPRVIERKETIRRILENVCQGPGRLLECNPCLVSFREVSNLPLRHRQTHIEQR